MTTYKEFLQTFKFACRVHRAELVQLKQIQNKAMRNQVEQYMEKDLQTVEDIFNKIDEVCGPSARVLIWMMYVEEKSVEEIGDLFDIPSSTVRRNVAGWLRKTFEEMQMCNKSIHAKET